MTQHKPQTHRPPTTLSPNPTGRRPRGPAHFASEDAAHAFAIGLPDDYTHYQLADLVEAVGRRAGWSPALVDHFRLLMEFTRPQDWLPGAQPIVWLSVDETAHRLCISTSQVGRNERALHRLGAIAWKDSPNHRRHGHRDPAGTILEAWGINLAPSAALAGRPSRSCSRSPPRPARAAPSSDACATPSPARGPVSFRPPTRPNEISA